MRALVHSEKYKTTLCSTIVNVFQLNLVCSVATALVTKYMHNLPLHPSCVSTLPEAENTLTSEIFTAFFWRMCVVALKRTSFGGSRRAKIVGRSKQEAQLLLQ